MTDYTTRYCEIERDQPAPSDLLDHLTAMCGRVGLKPPKPGITLGEAEDFRRAIGVRIARRSCR